MNPKSYLYKMGCYSAAVCFCMAIPAQADTTPFTFDVIYDVFVSSPPTPGHLTVESTATGSGTYSPFGNATYSETGSVTFGVLPSGDLFPFLVDLTFAASFNGGADSFTGTDVHKHDAAGNFISETITITGGTGTFSGATGFATPNTVGIAPSGNPSPNYFGTLETSGSGQITAPGLMATPEPTTLAFLGTGLIGLIGFLSTPRKRAKRCTSA